MAFLGTELLADKMPLVSCHIDSSIAGSHKAEMNSLNAAVVCDEFKSYNFKVRVSDIGQTDKKV